MLYILTSTRLNHTCTDSNEQTNTQSSDIHQIIYNIGDESLAVFADGLLYSGPVVCGACSVFCGAVLFPFE